MLKTLKKWMSLKIFPNSKGKKEEEIVLYQGQRILSVKGKKFFLDGETISFSMARDFLREKKWEEEVKFSLEKVKEIFPSLKFPSQEERDKMRELICEFMKSAMVMYNCMHYNDRSGFEEFFRGKRPDDAEIKIKLFKEAVRDKTAITNCPHMPVEMGQFFQTMGGYYCCPQCREEKEKSEEKTWTA
jgi:hypothetical protein